jgi:hypothetical protein
MPVTRLPEEAQEVRHQGQGRALAHGVLDDAIGQAFLAPAEARTLGRDVDDLAVSRHAQGL